MYNTKSDRNVNCGLWVLMMCQCSLIVTNVPPRCGMLMVGEAEGIWELSVLSAQFCSEPKTALKNKIYFLKEKLIGKTKQHLRNLVNFPL